LTVDLEGSGTKKCDCELLGCRGATESREWNPKSAQRDRYHLDARYRRGYLPRHRVSWYVQALSGEAGTFPLAHWPTGPRCRTVLDICSDTCLALST